MSFCLLLSFQAESDSVFLSTTTNECSLFLFFLFSPLPVSCCDFRTTLQFPYGSRVSFTKWYICVLELLTILFSFLCCFFFRVYTVYLISNYMILLLFKLKKTTKKIFRQPSYITKKNKSELKQNEKDTIDQTVEINAA